MPGRGIESLELNAVGPYVAKVPESVIQGEKGKRRAGVRRVTGGSTLPVDQFRTHSAQLAFGPRPGSFESLSIERLPAQQNAVLTSTG